MRTTVAIDDDVLDGVKSYAQLHAVSLGKAVSQLLARGLSAECPIVMSGEVAVLSPGPDAPVVTDADVARALDRFP